MNEEEETFTLCPLDTSVLKVTFLWTSWKRFSGSLCIIRTMTFELENSGTNTHLGVTGSRWQRSPNSSTCRRASGVGWGAAGTARCQAVGLWRGEAVGIGGRELTSPLVLISCFRGRRLIWLYKELIKRQPTSQCLVLHCRIYSQEANVFLKGQRLVSSLTNWHPICRCLFFPSCSLHFMGIGDGSCLVIDKISLREKNKGFNSLGLIFHLFFSYKCSIWVWLSCVSLHKPGSHLFITVVVHRLLDATNLLEILI